MPGCAASSRARRRRSWSNPLAGQLGSAPFKYFADWTDRIAKGELPHANAAAAAGRRAQHRRHRVGVGRARQVPARPDLDRQARSDRQRLRQALRLAGIRTDELPILDPVTNTVTSFHAPVRDPDMPLSLGHRARRDREAGDAVGLLGRRGDLGHAGQQPQHDDRQEGPGVAHRRGARPRQSGLLQGGLGPSVGQAVPAEAEPPPARGARSEDEEVHLRRHLLRDAPPAVRLRRRRHAVDQRRRPGGRLAQHEGVRRDRRRRQGAGLDGARARHQRQRQARRRTSSRTSRSIRRRTSASPAGFYAVMPSPVDGSVWGTVGVFGRQGGDRAARSRRESAGDGARRDLQRARSRASASRGADIDRKGVVWVSLGSGHLGSFDRRKCKGPLNGPEGHRRSLPRGLDASTSIPGPGFAGIGENSAEASYYTWVDQHNTLGPRRGRADLDRQS